MMIYLSIDSRRTNPNNPAFYKPVRKGSSQITNRFLPSNRRKLPIFQEKINNYLTPQTGSPNQEVLEFRKSPLCLIWRF